MILSLIWTVYRYLSPGCLCFLLITRQKDDLSSTLDKMLTQTNFLAKFDINSQLLEQCNLICLCCLFLFVVVKDPVL